MSDKVHDEASKVTAEDGVVMMDGPDGVAVSFSAEAALETSDRLYEAGMMAAGQAAMKPRERKDRPPPEFPIEDR